MDTIDVTGIDRVKLLVALYNNTQALGYGVIHDLGRDMTEEEATKILTDKKSGEVETSPVLDYVQGRPIKVYIKDDQLNRPDLYDRDCPKGQGSCQRIVDELRDA